LKYIELEVRTAFTVHGYDENNAEIIEESSEQEYMRKLIHIDRIQSISEDYVLVTSSHGRIMYWNYKGSMQELKQTLSKSNLIIE